MSPLIKAIGFQLEYAPCPRFVWAMACKRGYWRETAYRPWGGPHIRYRRMMAFERRNPTAPYMIGDYPWRTPERYITDFAKRRFGHDGPWSQA